MSFNHPKHPCYLGDHEFDHEFEYIDSSFDHEFGTESNGYFECKNCGFVDDAMRNEDYYPDELWDF